MVRAVVFDIDQTLWDFHSHRRQALTACLTLITERATESVVSGWTIDDLQARWDRLEAETTGEQLSAIRGRSLAEAARDAAPGDATLGDELTELYFSIRHGPATPYPDVTEALESLQHLGLRLAIVSNGNTDLAAMGIGHHFEATVLGPRVGMAKPEPRIYRHVEQQLDLSAADLVCVGDDPHKDVSAPQQAGWRGVWNDRDGEPLPPTVNPDATVGTLTELVPIVADWAATSR